MCARDRAARNPRPPDPVYRSAALPTQIRYQAATSCDLYTINGVDKVRGPWAMRGGGVQGVQLNPCGGLGLRALWLLTPFDLAYRAGAANDICIRFPARHS